MKKYNIKFSGVCRIEAKSKAEATKKFISGIQLGTISMAYRVTEEESNKKRWWENDTRRS